MCLSALLVVCHCLASYVHASLHCFLCISVLLVVCASALLTVCASALLVVCASTLLVVCASALLVVFQCLERVCPLFIVSSKLVSKSI